MKVWNSIIAPQVAISLRATRVTRGDIFLYREENVELLTLKQTFHPLKALSVRYSFV